MGYNDPSGHCGESVMSGNANVGTIARDVVCWEILAEAAGATVAVTGGTAAPIVFIAAGAYVYENSTWQLPTVAPLQPETLPDDGFTVSIPVPGSTTLTSPQVLTSSSGSDTVGVGSANGERAGKGFTKTGKQTVVEQNKEANSGVTRCENCGVVTIPAQKSQSGIAPPVNETQVDHIIPRVYGGDGSPGNGQLLCRSCNRQKSNNLQ